MKINCIAIDDEPPALLQMEDYISRIPYLNLLKTFDNALDAMDYLKNNEVDLIFLDIEMEGFSGIQFLRTIKHKPYIILTTAYDTYAIQAFDLDVADYLLKPISFERFLKSTEKVADIRGHENKPAAMMASAENQQGGRGYMFVKTDYRIKRVDFKDILYVEGLKEYLMIITPAGKVITLQNFKNMEEMLPPSNFVRVHKSFIIALDKIESIERNHIKIAGRMIPIGDTYRKVFYDKLTPGSL